MPHNHNRELLPVPADLYTEIGELQDRVEELRRDLRRVRHAYSELELAPDSLAVDDLGAPVTPTEMTTAARAWLLRAESGLDRAEDGLSRAHTPASRLKLTEAAADLREQQLAHRDRTDSPRRGVDRTR
ncbi:hypothetical protein [Nocardia cyriacigeorgica]|uniref:hypothetical protein n=1 Tax=Nocardia cyriacigeorgica TaxID=135487 RepID=UPI002453CA68|nr:hypothetical protein [Nocardia cyriacigeorgica]